MRLSGLASGLDIDAMVKELMKARSTSYNNMIKDRTKVEWKQEDYRTLSAKIVDFRNNKLSSFNMSSAINAKKSEVSGDAASIQINSTAPTAAGTLSIKVDQLATTESRVYRFGAGSLESLGFTVDPSNSANVAVTINNQKISVSKTATLADLATAINANSSKTKATALYNAATGQFSISATETGTGKLQVNDSVFNPLHSKTYSFETGKTLEELGFELKPSDSTSVIFNLNGTEITLSKDATLDDLVTYVNDNSTALKATASVNASGALTFTSSEASAEVSITGQAFSAKTPISNVVITNGKDAKVTINGIDYTQSSNRFQVNGIDFTAKALSATEARLTVSSDTSKIVETIKSFVTEYNILIGSINSELSEASFRAYKPLTSDEKAELSDKEIELWESKARSGTLRNDATLTELVSSLRLTTTQLIAGIKLPNNEKIAIGITTGSYSEKGKLVLDEAMLTEALESNADEVVNLFTNNSTGIFKQMSDASMTALKSLYKYAGTSMVSADANASFLESSLLSQEIRDMKSREQMMLARLNNMETQYYKQFSAMETAINKFNSQSSSLSSFM